MVVGRAAGVGAGSGSGVRAAATRGSCAAGVEAAGSASGAPQETRWSRSPPKPVCRETSACQAEAGSGRVSATGSSSRKTGPVSSTAGTGVDGATGAGEGFGAIAGPAGIAPAGAVGGASPSLGAGRLVPGTQAPPFQYRMYPGMDGSG